MRNDLISVSKFLSLVLRHQPEAIGLTLSADGWARVDELLVAARRHGREISPELLEEVVFTNDKQRFAFSADGASLRANQGHSIEVDLQLESTRPPERLFHGTASRFLAAIGSEGLRPMSRNHVHLSALEETARRVGARHGQPVVLTVHALRMFEEGIPFYLAANGVWLVEAVPAGYLGGLPESAAGDPLAPSSVEGDQP